MTISDKKNTKKHYQKKHGIHFQLMRFSMNYKPHTNGIEKEEVAKRIDFYGETNSRQQNQPHFSLSFFISLSVR
jgi:hypothetical protein